MLISLEVLARGNGMRRRIVELVCNSFVKGLGQTSWLNQSLNIIITCWSRL